jgi:hypothetical protein
MLAIGVRSFRTDQDLSAHGGKQTLVTHEGSRGPHKFFKGIKEKLENEAEEEIEDRHGNYWITRRTIILPLGLVNGFSQPTMNPAFLTHYM